MGNPIYRRTGGRGRQGEISLPREGLEICSKGPRSRTAPAAVLVFGREHDRQHAKGFHGFA